MAMRANRMIAFSACFVVSIFDEELCSLPSFFSFASSFFSSPKNIPMLILCCLNFSDAKTFVPRSAGSSEPGKWRRSQSPWVTLILRMLALFRRCRVRQEPLSPTTIAMAAVLSVCDTATAFKSKASSKTTRTASPAKAPSKTSTSSASAVEAVTTDCFPLFQRRMDLPHITRWHPVHTSLKEASV